MAHTVIIADDLTGAADCGVVCAAAGLATKVMLGSCKAEPDTAVLVIDAHTRSLDQDAAVAETRRLVRAHAPADRMLFRKIDSTLRGHVGAELAATLAVRRELGRAVIVLAPAYPATGRTTRFGHQHLHGVRLEHTEIWRHERLEGRAHIPEMLAGSGLSVAAIDLDAVRAGGLSARVPALAEAHDVLVFDAELETDLAATVAACAALPGVIWAGSAGLARHLPQVAAGALALGEQPGWHAAALPKLVGGVLFVVASASAVSRAQLARLVAEPGVVHLIVPVIVLRAGHEAPGWNRLQDALDDALADGFDVAVSVGDDEPVDLRSGEAISRSLARFVAPAGRLAGAVVLTGGATARAVLQAVGASALRLVGELEPGVPLAILQGSARAPRRPCPVITKAGAFGTAETLSRCRAALRRPPATQTMP